MSAKPVARSGNVSLTTVTALGQIIKTPIGIHFNSIGHNLSHLKVTPIELLNSDSVPWRRAREAYWQLTLGTIFPLALNNFPIHLEHSFKTLEIISAVDWL